MVATIRAIVILGLVCVAGCSQPAADIIPNAALRIAYVDDGTLFLWQSGQVEEVVSGDVIQPYISPAGSKIVYTTGEDDSMPETLWLVEAKSISRINSQSFLYQIDWLDSSTLYYNTFERQTLGPRARNDLHRVSLPAGETEAIAPGGYFSVSPSGVHVIVVSPGIYGAEPGAIYLLDGDTTQELMTFDSVATGSHLAFYPEIQWQGDDLFYVAIPEADMIYNELAEDAAPVPLWSVDLTTNQVEAVEAVQASFYGLPQIMNEQLVYLRRVGNRFSVYVDDIEYTSGDAGTLLPPRWLPDGERFIYAQDGFYWIGQSDEEAHRWLEVNPMTTPTILAEGIVYTTLNGEGQFEIRYAAYDSDAYMLIAQTGQTPPAYDAVMAQ